MMDSKIISHKNSIGIMPSSPDFVSVLKEIQDDDEIMKDKILVFQYDKWGFPLDMILGIRLSLLFLKEKALNPIAIISDKTKTELLESGEGYAELLLTPGIRVFKSIDELEGLKSISINEYYNKFLPYIKVTSKVGSHSIANEWAAYNMGRLINENKNDIPESNDLLYLCYLLVNGMKKEQLQKLIENTTQAGDRDQKDQINKVTNKKGGRRKILLIDDQDDIWGEIIRQLVTDNGKDNNIELDVWGKKALDISFDEDTKKDTKVVSEIKINEKGDYHKDIIKDYDVVLLDMRLAGKNEQHQDTERLSGIQVLKQILDEEKGGNPGQRVIVFTSSNKAWNIKRCLEIGAQSIFIKESPMYPLQENERIENINTLIDDINKGLEYSWLKDVFRFSKAIIEKCDEIADEYSNYEDEYEKEKYDFYTSLADQVYIATKFFLGTNFFLKAKREDEEYEEYEDLRLAFISLENVFELISQEWLKSGEETSVADHVCNLIKKFGINNLDSYEEHAIGKLTFIRNKLIHSDKPKTYKCYLTKKDEYPQLKWRLDKDTTYQFIKIGDYVKSFRALMYLLYLIFVNPK